MRIISNIAANVAHLLKREPKRHTRRTSKITSKFLPALHTSFTLLLLLLILSPIFITINCANPANENPHERFTFVVADVGQGLAQFAVMNGRAVAIDLGLPAQHTAWRAAHGALGRPALDAIIISHADNDHHGGLRHLDAGLDWDGLMIVSPHEDTAFLRSITAAVWRDRVTFSQVVRGDTLYFFDGAVSMICLWPPVEIDAELPLEWLYRNRYSLVLSVRHGHSRVLVTSDIDENAMGRLAAISGYDLRAQILSVPHHGSGGSVHPLFFSYVNADIAIISSGAGNSYGHPTISMIDALTVQGSRILYTSIDHTVIYNSNGFYWERGR